MSTYTGNPYITHEDLQTFNDWLLQNPTPDRGYDLKFENPDLSLILFDQANRPKNFNETQQRFLAQILSRSDLNDKAINDVLDHADKFPELLARLNEIAGNSYSGGIYDRIHNTLEKRKLVDNLPAIHAILTINHSVFRPGEGEITKLSAKNHDYLNKIFEMSKFSDYGNSYEASEVLNVISDQLLNCEQVSPELRNFINSRVNSTKQLDRLKIDFYTPELLAKILTKGLVSAKRTEKTDTSKAKTQKEKNINILPPYYLKTRDALLQLAKKENPYDSKNYGQLKSLTRRYKELCARLVGKKEWEMIPEDIKNGVMKDGLLTAAQKDIINGDVAKLDKKDIEMVLAQDKKNFYLRKIPKDVFYEKKINSDKAEIFTLSDDFKIQHINNLVENRNYTAKEKEELIATGEKRIEQDQPLKENCEKLIANYTQDKITLQKKSQDYADQQYAVEQIGKIQKAVEVIGQYFKEGKANEQEAHLTREAVEKFLVGYLSGEKYSLPQPEYKSLPLIMGRKAEEQRRNSVKTAVSQFNDAMKHLPEEKKALLAPYSGKLLEVSTLDEAKEKVAQSSKDYNAFDSDFSQKYRQIETIKQTHETLVSNEKRFESAKEKLDLHKKALQSVADEHLGKNSPQLQVTDDMMSGVEKNVIRAHNKTVKDSLAEKEKALQGKTDQEKVQMTVKKIRGR